MKGSTSKYRQKNGKPSWRYHWRSGKDASGKWIRLTKQGFKTQREAEDALAERKQEHAAQQKAPVCLGETFAEFFAFWIEEYARRHCQPKTAERYEQLGQYAIQHFGDVRLTELTHLILEQAFNRLLDHGGKKSKQFPEGRPLAPKTVREVAFLTRLVLKKAKAWDKIQINPCDFERITLVKAQKKEAAMVEKPAFSRFLETVKSTRYYALVLLAAATGCRRGELLALEWADLNFRTGVLQVTKSLEETRAGVRVKSTKSGKPRSFVVPRWALEALEEHREQQDRDRSLFGSDYQDHGLIFCRPDGGYYRPDQISAWVGQLARRSGLPLGIGLHALRHTHASELLSKGAPIPVVSKRLGHANPNVTLRIYAHALEADELASAQIWEDAMADVIAEQRKNSGAERVSQSVTTKRRKLRLTN